MLSSIMLSMAISVSPVSDGQNFNDQFNLNIETTGRKRGTRRLNDENSLNVEVAGRKRGTRRL